MTGADIRQKFLDFFAGKDHKIVQSDLLVPRNDPTLLFTGAGMNQFKEQFMGRNVKFPRAASCQKCLRTGDLENVGRTPRHHTFFEMLGNFSFGDYFKKDAIKWAWEFMTEVMGIPEEKLWVSVYTDDDEACAIWSEEVGVPGRKIVRLGEHYNFWPADAPSQGPNGPCGPCSEIFFDQGEDVGCGKKECDPSCDCDRFLEVWNLVFTEFERQPDGSLLPLPNKNIDTGMGLERITAVMQGVKANFETDLFAPITEKIEKELNGAGKDKRDINLIADHIRAAVFAIGDGVSPSNEKQGYVVRKLIRRAFLKSGKRAPFLYMIVPAVTSMMEDVYPDTRDKSEHIGAIIQEEEKRFCATLDSAMPVLEDMLRTRPSGLSGEQLFKLVDTYGMPLDVIQEEVDAELDIEGFNRLMDERKEQSRKTSDISADFIFKPDSFSVAPRPEFADELPLEATLEFVLSGNRRVDSLSQGDKAEVITAPQSAALYSEAGGQVGDKGLIIKDGGTMEIVNTVEADGRKVLQVVVTEGSFSAGDKVRVELDSQRKKMIARNHTATHLLQAALRKVLGEQVKQSGSLVTDSRLRFDFTHMKKLSDRELMRIEDLVNQWVSRGIGVCKETKSIELARAEGALSFFGEKYGDTVRVVTVGGQSKELCGGTHVQNTSEIGLVKITSQSAVASGVRRIEAVSGETAVRYVRDELGGLVNRIYEFPGGREAADTNEAVKEASDIAEGKKQINRDLLHKVEESIKPGVLSLISGFEKAEKKRRKIKDAGAFERVRKELDVLMRDPVKYGGFEVIAAAFQDTDMGTLRKAIGYVQSRLENSVVLLAGEKAQKAMLVCAVSRAAGSKGLSARTIVGSAAEIIGGAGGGKDDFAQAGGRDPAKLEEAIESAKKLISERLG